MIAFDAMTRRSHASASDKPGKPSAAREGAFAPLKPSRAWLRGAGRAGFRSSPQCERSRTSSSHPMERCESVGATPLASYEGPTPTTAPGHNDAPSPVRRASLAHASGAGAAPAAFHDAIPSLKVRVKSVTSEVFQFPICVQVSNFSSSLF